MTSPLKSGRNEASDKSAGRVLAIAFDGATWDLARDWLKAGHMPNLARIISDGVAAEMHAELPPSSVPNWPAFMTGKNAGKHGCLWWLQRDESGGIDRVPIDANSISGDTLWSYLSAMGKKVIVLNVPVTYPPQPVNGVLISGLLTPRAAQDFIHPASLAPELNALLGGYRIYPEGSFARGRETAFLESLEANIRDQARAADYLLSTQPWDFFMMVVGPTDEGAHRYWHYLDPTHWMHDDAEHRRFGDSMLRLYRSADEALGRIMEHARPQDTVIVLSDHGFGPLERFFLPNNWLRQRGYLRLKGSAATLLRSGLFRLGLTPSALFPLGKELLSLLPGSGKIRQRMDPGRQGARSPLRRLFLSSDDIDWSRTQAVATGFLCSQIYLNLRGREPAGIVEAAEYEPLRSKLIDELSALVDPGTGAPHYARIYRREELYSGPKLDSLPDLICMPANLRTADAGMDFRANGLFTRDSSLSGTHRVEGMFAMRGPGVRRGIVLPPLRIYDLAPTILFLLGLPIPEDMDGRVVAEVFTDGARVSREIRYTSPRHVERPDAADYEDSDAESIEDRLRDLGYLA